MSPDDPIFDQWPGLRYTMAHWCEHARRSAGYAAKDLFEAAEFMVQEKSALRINWWQTYVNYHGADLTLHKEEKKMYESMSWQEKNAQRQLDRATPLPLHIDFEHSYLSDDRDREAVFPTSVIPDSELAKVWEPLTAICDLAPRLETLTLDTPIAVHSAVLSRLPDELPLLQ